MPFTRNADVEIFYETFGDPSDPTLVLVNGLGSQCTNYRVEWCERFASRGFHVVRMDNRDVGLSTKFADTRPDVMGVVQAMAKGQAPTVPYTVHDMAADVIAVLDALGVQRAHVFGLSMGGMIVQTLAIEHPDRLLSATSLMSSTGEPEYGQSTDEARARLFGPPATNREEYIANHLAGLRIWGSPGKVDFDAQAQFAAEAFDRNFCPEGVGRQMMAILADGSRAERLRNVHVPMLVMHGTADTLITPSGGKRTAELVPGARYVELEGMGHDYPVVYWDALVGLVAEHAAAAVG